MNTHDARQATALAAGLLLMAMSPNVRAAAVTGVDLSKTVTATMDGGTTKSGDTWYEAGVNTAAPTHGLTTGIVAAQYDPLSTYLIQPATGNNVLLLNTNTTSGTLSFSKPLAVTGLSFDGSSGHAGTAPTLTATLHFSDGTSDKLTGFKVPDWFNNTPAVETANGRISVTGNTFDNEASDNPRLLAINTTLPAADQTKFITSIDLSFAPGENDTDTAIFGVSADFTGLGHFNAIPLDGTSFNQDVIVGLKEVPEPGTLALLGVGALGLLVYHRRNKS